jgi:hypothetical protein
MFRVLGCDFVGVLFREDEDEDGAEAEVKDK